MNAVLLNHVALVVRSAIGGDAVMRPPVWVVSPDALAKVGKELLERVLVTVISRHAAPLASRGVDGDSEAESLEGLDCYAFTSLALYLPDASRIIEAGER